MKKNDTNPSVCTSKWTRPCGSSIWEPDLYPSREEYDAHVAREQKAEENRCKELRAKMEEAICRNFSGEELIKIQLYKEAIFSYLKDNAKYGIECNPIKLGNYVVIYYKKLLGKQLTTSEYSFLQLNSRTINNIIAQDLRSRYSDYEDVLEIVSIELGITKEEIILLIDRSNVTGDETALDKFKNEVIKLLKLKQNDSFAISVADFCTAINRIKELRCNPEAMGLTHDGMRLKMDKILPPLRPRRR